MTKPFCKSLLAVLLGVAGCLSAAGSEQTEVLQGPGELEDKGLAGYNGFQSKNGATPFNGFRAFNGLSVINGLPVVNGNVAGNGMSALNGHRTWNGTLQPNGMQAHNGFTAFNGVKARNGLNSVPNLLSDLIERGATNNAEYVVKCALRADQVAFGYAGKLGVCPEYATESIEQNVACQEKISSCLMALTNYHGLHVQVELRSPIPSIGPDGTGQQYTIQEGRYFGNFWGDNPQAFFCVNRKYAGSMWGNYVAVPRMCEYTDGTWNGDFWSGGTPANNWMMDKCAYPIAGICEDICKGWSCTYGGKTYDNPIEVWRYGGPNSYATAKVNRDYLLHFGGMPVVPSKCMDDTQYETHGRPAEGGYRSCADFTDRPCDDLSNVWGQSAIQTWEAKHHCPRACKAPQTCSVLYEAEHATAQAISELKNDQAGATGLYVDYGKGGQLAFDNVIVRATTNYRITVRYNTGGKSQSDLELWINGALRVRTRLAMTNNAAWSKYTWTQQLTEGQNTIVLKDVGYDSPNLDSMTVSPVDFSTSTGNVVLQNIRLSGVDQGIASYSFNVPAGARGVNVSVYNQGYDATPDLDVFVRKGSEPSTSYSGTDYCRNPFADQEGRHCSFSSADQTLGATWYVKIKGWGAYGGGSGEGWELKATYY